MSYYPLLSQEQQNMFVAFVNGKSGAELYPVAPNNTAFLIDFNSKMFWVKSVKNSGIPEPMREFSFEEIIKEDKNSYATKEDFLELKKMIERLMPVEVGKNAVATE